MQMAWTSSKVFASKIGACPKTIVSWILISIGGLALLRILVSWDLELNNTPTSSYSQSANATSISSFDSGCDLYHGRWVYDQTVRPAYTASCPFMSGRVKCQANGRPDSSYENWRWKPSQCDLPPFDAIRFLELMGGKTIAFIGDSVSRGHMEALLCTLQQVELPEKGSNRRMQTYTFKSSSVTIVRIWSSRLINETHGDLGPDGVVKLHLDIPDRHFIDLIPQFDVMVLSSGHWFEKHGVPMLNNEVVHLNKTQAYGISVETVLTSIVTHQQYNGITIFRTFSPKHFEGGKWDEGGTCTGNVMPISEGELVENKDVKSMHEKQVMGFKSALRKKKNKSKLRLMDITEAFLYRHDGHPGRYGHWKGKQKITGLDGKAEKEDCLHWCGPGAVDTWNQFLLEILRSEYEGKQNL